MTLRSALASYRRPPVLQAAFWLVELSVVGIFLIREYLNDWESGHLQVVPPFAVLALFSIPVLIAALNFGFYGSVITAAIATLLAGWAMEQDLAIGNPLSAWAESAQIVIIDVVGALVGHYQETVGSARQRIAEYATRLVRGQEEERGRIARELHDQPVQVLIQLCRQLDEAATGGSLEDARAMAEGVVADLRTIAEGLRPAPLADLGLVAAVDQLVRTAQAQSAATITLSVEGDPFVMPLDVELAAFRIAQEALTNTARHASATKVEVALSFDKDGLELAITDNGAGFNTTAVNGPSSDGGDRGLGLMGMRERAAMIGSKLDIASAPGSGTRLSMRALVTDPPERHLPGLDGKFAQDAAPTRDFSASEHLE